jgi:hypothetical protein
VKGDIVKIRTAVLTALLVLFAAVAPALADGEAIFDDIITGNLDTGTLSVETNASIGGFLSVGGDVYAQNIARLEEQVATQARWIDKLTTRVTNLERRLACVENKPTQVRPKCPTS